MSNLLDKATLVLTPSAIKSSEIYSIKPDTGAGDFTFARAGSATGVDANGLIELPATNLTLRSEEFDNASWIKTGANVTANAYISPRGTLAADLLTCTTASTNSNLSQAITVPSGSATLSVFARAGNHNIFRIANVSSSTRAAWFDLSEGTVIGSVNGGTAKIEDYGGGWFRCIFTATSSSSGSNAFIISISSAANSTNGVIEANIYLWGAQLYSTTVTSTEYIPTTTAVRTRFAGITQDVSSASNIPRLDYTNYPNGSCPTILLEGEKTNYCKFSDPVSAPASNQMTSTNVTFEPNDWNFGLNGKIIFDNSNGTTCAYNNSSQTLSIGTYTISFYAKRTDGGEVSFGAAGTGSTIKDIVVLFQNSTTRLGNTYSTTLVRDGIYKCVMTGTSDINSSSFGVRKSMGESANIVEVSGIQIENGAFNTTYIPTSGAPTVRLSETLSFDNLDTYINSDSSAWYLELKNNIPLARVTNGSMHIGTDIGSTVGWGLRLTQDVTTPQRIKLQKIENGPPISIYTTVETAGDTVKILFNWSEGTLTTWVNGSQVGSSAFSITGDIKYARFNANDRPKNIANCVFFNTSLTSREAQQLTGI